MDPKHEKSMKIQMKNEIRLSPNTYFFFKLYMINASPFPSLPVTIYLKKYIGWEERKRYKRYIREYNHQIPKSKMKSHSKWTGCNVYD